MRLVTHRLPRQFLLILLILSACFLFTPQSVLTRAARVQVREVLAQEPGVSPTPEPSPSTPPRRKSSSLKRLGRRVLDFLSCNPANKRKTQELSRNGPQFPADYEMSDFSIEALVKGSWAVTIEYELEPDSTVSITFTAKDVEPFSQTFSTQDAGPNQPNVLTTGGPQKRDFQLPERFGEKPQAALISFRALADGPNGKRPANFQLNSLGIGDQPPDSTSTKTNQRGQQTVEMNALYIKASAQGFQPFYNFGSRLMMGPKAVAIVDISIRPQRIRPGGTFNYTFSSTNFFPAGRAEYRRDVKTLRPNGTYIYGTEYVAGENFTEPVNAGRNPQPPPIERSKKWNVRPRVSLGKYRIQVFAWNSVKARGEGGESATRISSPPVNID
jgi:hypothetical protein